MVPQKVGEKRERAEAEEETGEEAGEAEEGNKRRKADPNSTTTVDRWMDRDALAPSSARACAWLRGLVD